MSIVALILACSGPQPQPGDTGAPALDPPLRDSGRPAGALHAVDLRIDGRSVRTLGELDGDALVVEGDIRLPLADLTAPPSAARAWESTRWPDGRIPYEVESSLSTAAQLRIAAAIAHWNEASERTGVVLVPHSTEPQYAELISSPGRCSSPIGYSSTAAAPLQVHISDSSLAPCSTGAIIHELGHLVGLLHEHTRVDRDDFVTVDFDDIEAGKEFNFRRHDQDWSDGADLGRYDLESVMHYQSDTFASNPLLCRPAGLHWGCPLLTVDGAWIDDRDTLSDLDIGAVARMYTDTWQVSYGATWGWETLHSSSVDATELRALRANDPDLADAEETAHDLLWVAAGRLRIRDGETRAERDLGRFTGSIDQLVVADVDGDGFDDLVRPGLAEWQVSWGADGTWESYSGPTGAPALYVWARVDSAPGAEPVRELGGTWQRWDSSGSRWSTLDSSGRDLASVLWGDFDGDGLDDALWATELAWELREGATGAWSSLDHAYGDRALVLAYDGDDDGTDEVLLADGSGWLGLDIPVTAETELLYSAITADRLLVGDFDGVGGEDILTTMSPYGLDTEVVVDAQTDDSDGEPTWYHGVPYTVQWQVGTGEGLERVDQWVWEDELDEGLEQVVDSGGASGTVEVTPSTDWGETTVDVRLRATDGTLVGGTEVFPLRAPSIAVEVYRDAVGDGSDQYISWTGHGLWTVTVTIEQEGVVVDTIAEDELDRDRCGRRRVRSLRDPAGGHPSLLPALRRHLAGRGTGGRHPGGGPGHGHRRHTALLRGLLRGRPGLRLHPGRRPARRQGRLPGWPGLCLGRLRHQRPERI